MTNLEIHIDTSVHCADCREVIEYFANGSRNDLVDKHRLYNVTNFEAKASQFFVQQGWRQQSDGSWLCTGCESIANERESESARERDRRAA